MAVGVWQGGRFTRLLWMVSQGCVRLPTWRWWCSPPSPSQRSSLWSCCDPCVSHKPHHKVPWVHRFPQTEYCYLKRQIITNLLLITESFFKMKYWKLNEVKAKLERFSTFHQSSWIKAPMVLWVHKYKSFFISILKWIFFEVTGLKVVKINQWV